MIVKSCDHINVSYKRPSAPDPRPAMLIGTIDRDDNHPNSEPLAILQLGDDRISLIEVLSTHLVQGMPDTTLYPESAPRELKVLARVTDTTGKVYQSSDLLPTHRRVKISEAFTASSWSDAQSKAHDSFQSPWGLIEWKLRSEWTPWKKHLNGYRLKVSEKSWLEIVPA